MTNIPDKASVRWRSRRFFLCLVSISIGGLGVYLDHELAGFAILVGTVLAGYGFTRGAVADIVKARNGHGSKHDNPAPDPK